MARTYTAALRRRLGLTEEQLPDDASDAHIAFALDSVLAAAPRRTGPAPRRVTQTDREPPGWKPPQEELTEGEREGILLTAVEAGKFSAERAKHYRQELIRDPRGTAQVIAMLTPVPEVTKPRSSAAPMSPGTADEGYPAHWLGPIEASRQAQTQMVNPPLAEQRGVQASGPAPLDGGDAYPGQQAPPPPPGPVTFEDPGMAMKVVGEGWRRDRQIEHERGEAFARP